jgi:glutamyl-tRNA synthetase
MKITSVIRGEEWLSSLPSHVLLYEHFGWTPPKFYHLPLILKSSGAGKLSKRDADEQGHPVFAVKWEESRGFKEAGFTSEGLVNYLALLGWNNSSDKEKYTLFELIDEFNDGGINKSGARFDLKKALWVNHLHIKDFSAEKVLALSEKATTQLGEKYSSDRTEEIINLIKERLNTALDIDKELAVFIGQPKEYDQDVIEKINREIIFDVLNFCKLSEALMSNPKTLKDQLMSFGSEKGISFGNIMKTLRLCLVGNLSGPDLFKIIEFIGPEETLHRIESLTNKI